MFKRIFSIILCIALVVTASSIAVTTQAATTNSAQTAADTNVSTTSATLSGPSDFSWDNASVYFLLTDRFYNGNTSNDHSYNRGLNQSGKVVKGNSDVGAFHGGDFAGITKKISEGYFDNLGVTALWISAPYEQIHGYCNGGQGKSGSFPHYSYHGYYALDFSQTDANFGTEKEFETMVDTAHSHGIRIVLDVVMNHVGYNTMYDMNEYGFGTLKSGWQTPYFNASLTDTTYSSYIDYNSDANAWGKWWGTNWIRAGLAGYKEDGSGDLTGSQSYLPDIRTESTNTVDIPQILKTKWQKEGTLSKKTTELNNFFNTGKPRRVRNYLVFWLSQWVEKYGVDGFRCDTAKHVELDSWKALKDQCLQSLRTWRSKNPTKPGADWDEDFWMTGECYTHYLKYDNYYTQGGFDSMINFSFNDNNSFDANASGVPGAGSINNTYAEYAGKLNTNDKFNVLSYLSSHDTRLCRNNMIYQGSAFQLLPGAIQIYYGDECNRPLGTFSSGKDHNLRTDMNWNNLDNNLLQHWQKVGKFRSNHVAVGAGSHTKLSATSGTAFARNYNKNGVKDTVAAVIGANSNQNVTITLNNTFANGTIVKNAYDGTTATVSGGKVSFNSGKNGTILIETEGKTEPTTESTAPTTMPTTAPSTPTSAPTTPSTPAPTSAPTTPTESNVPTTPTQSVPVVPTDKYGDANCDSTIDILDVTVIQKHLAALGSLTAKGSILADVDGNGYISIKDATYIQKYLLDMGDTKRVGTGYSDPNASAAPTEPPTPAPTQAPAPEPTPEPTTEPPYIPDPPTDPPTDPPSGTVVYFDNAEGWQTPYIYFWTGSSGPMEWPGTPMEMDSEGRWTYTIPEGYDQCIFSNNGNPQTDDLFPQNGMTYHYYDKSWS